MPVLVVTCAVLPAPPAHAGPAAGSWEPAGRLSADRNGSTVTVLADARVLVAGGGTPEVATAEVFDPAEGEWRQTGAMGVARTAAAAVRLPDGTVLVCGGAVGSEALTEADIYDPASGTWRPTGPMAVARQSHTATLLADGKVLVVGGLGGGHGPYRAEAELFDPATGSWVPTGTLAQGRAHHSATLLADGKVLVVGGEGDTHGDSLRDAAVYDPGTGTWSAVPQLLETGRADHTATAMLDGTVLVAGGTRVHIGGRPEDTLSSAELLDRSGQVFLPGPAMAQRRRNHTATLLAGGLVLVLGGYGDRIATATATAELYDPSARRWTPAAAPPGPVAGHGAVVVAGSSCGSYCGKVLVVAGRAAFAFTPPEHTGTADTANRALLGGVLGGGAVLAGALAFLAARRRRRSGPARSRSTSPRGTRQTLEHR